MTAALRETLGPRRLLVLVVTWGALWAGAAALGFAVQPLGLLGIVAVVVLGHGAFGSAHTPWEPPAWTAPAHNVGGPSHRDGRLRQLHRTIDNATSRRSDPQTIDRTSAQIQVLVRDLVRHRIRAGHRVVPDLEEAVRARDPVLADYLTADPAPHLDLHRLHELTDRIEDL